MIWILLMLLSFLIALGSGNAWFILVGIVCFCMQNPENFVANYDDD